MILIVPWLFLKQQRINTEQKTIKVFVSAVSKSQWLFCNSKNPPEQSIIIESSNELSQTELDKLVTIVLDKKVYCIFLNIPEASKKNFISLLSFSYRPITVI